MNNHMLQHTGAGRVCVSASSRQGVSGLHVVSDVSRLLCWQTDRYTCKMQLPIVHPWQKQAPCYTACSTVSAQSKRSRRRLTLSKVMLCAVLQKVDWSKVKRVPGLILSRAGHFEPFVVWHPAFATGVILRWEPVPAVGPVPLMIAWYRHVGHAGGQGLYLVKKNIPLAAVPPASTWLSTHTRPCLPKDGVWGDSACICCMHSAQIS